MAISNTRQFALLLWKNWLLQKRRIALTAFQILLPAVLALVLLLIRQRVESTFHENATVWNSFEVNAALPGNLVPPRDLSRTSSSSTASTSISPHSFSTHGDDRVSTISPSGPRSGASVSDTNGLSMLLSSSGPSWLNLSLGGDSSLTTSVFTASSSGTSQPNASRNTKNTSSTSRPLVLWQIAFSPDVPVVRRLVTATVKLLNDATRAATPYIGVAIGNGKYIRNHTTLYVARTQQMSELKLMIV